MSKDLLKAIEEFKQAFVIAVGDKSPFAKTALKKLDDAVSAEIIRNAPSVEGKQ